MPRRPLATLLTVLALAAAMGAAGCSGADADPVARAEPVAPAAEPTDLGELLPSEIPTPSTSASAAPSASRSKVRPTTAKPTTSRPRTVKPSPRRTKKKAKPASPATTKPSGKSGSLASQVVALVNEERAKEGCGALTVNSKLTSAAQGHSQDMADKGYFDHTDRQGRSPSERVTAAGYRWRMTGENIAMGQRSAASVMDSWMGSSGHRRNILNCSYRHIGVGVVTDGGPYWTQVFASPA